MFIIKLLNKDTNKMFEKKYNSFYIYNKELCKYRHSKKLQIISIEKI